MKHIEKKKLKKGPKSAFRKPSFFVIFLLLFKLLKDNYISL